MLAAPKGKAKPQCLLAMFFFQLPIGKAGVHGCTEADIFTLKHYFGYYLFHLILVYQHFLNYAF
jgi:hypothetical protein